MNGNIKEVFLNNSSNSSNVTSITNHTSSFFDNSSSSIINPSSTTFIVPQVDPNWFYSASAQSAAAIVGLMGAFITTKLINHKSFVTQLKKEITEYQNKIDFINREIEQKSQYINALDYETDSELVDNFLDFLKDVIDPNDPLSLDEIYDITQKYPEFDEYRDINRDILEQKFNFEYLDKVRAHDEDLVDKFLDDMTSKIDPENPPTLNDLFEKAKETNDYKFIKKSILEEKYNNEYLDNISKQKLKLPRNIFGTIMKNIDMSLPYGQSSSYMSNLLSESNTKTIQVIGSDKIKWEKYLRYKEEVAERKAELSYYEDLLRHKNIQLKSKEEISSLQNNIITLLVFSVTGIFLPLFMMLLDYEIMMEYRVLTYILIFAGWGIVVAHLFIDVVKLLKDTY